MLIIDNVIWGLLLSHLMNNYMIAMPLKLFVVIRWLVSGMVWLFQSALLFYTKTILKLITTLLKVILSTLSFHMQTKALTLVS